MTIMNRFGEKILTSQTDKTSQMNTSMIHVCHTLVRLDPLGMSVHLGTIRGIAQVMNNQICFEKLFINNIRIDFVLSVRPAVQPRATAMTLVQVGRIG